MLVDLGRNDVGRVARVRTSTCTPAQRPLTSAESPMRVSHASLLMTRRICHLVQAGSVKVERLMEIERYSHVMHISSTVTGAFQRSTGPSLSLLLPLKTTQSRQRIRLTYSLASCTALCPPIPPLQGSFWRRCRRGMRCRRRSRPGL